MFMPRRAIADRINREPATERWSLRCRRKRQRASSSSAGGRAWPPRSTRPSFAKDGTSSATRTLDGRPVPFQEPFWFAVAAFRPDIEIVEE
jgi:hypothetical protein